MPAALWCKSNFSFLEGASHPEELVEQAHQNGLHGLALTDRDGLYGVVRAHVKAKELGVRLVIGAEVSLTDGSKIILLAQNRRGYGHLCSLLTLGRRRCSKGSSQVSWGEVAEYAEGLIALWGGEGSLLVSDSGPGAVGASLRDAFGDRLHALLTRHRRPEEVRQEARLRMHARALGLPIVAGTEVLYHCPPRRRVQDVLTCIRHHCTLVSAGRRIKPNAEHDLKSPVALQRLFKDDPAALAHTDEVLQRCSFSMSEIRYRYPVERLPDGKSGEQWLADLSFEGARSRHGGELPEAMRTQLERELRLIAELDYAGYFLTMWEIVEFCKERGILCQGRGSAANSAVCYCLGITAIDPVRMGLLFERFLSKERAEPPDIDLDIEHERREEVIQHVYEKYGRNHAAMVANTIRYRPRSAVRDVGKALGLPATGLDRLVRLLGNYDDIEPRELDWAGLGLDAPSAAHLLDLSHSMIGFPRHLSIHPGGFLLGHDPVSTLVPIENATMHDRTVIQWDKDDVEALGLFKVDLLGLGALTHLHRCFDLVREHRGTELAMATIPAEDAATYEQICRADTVGVFQIESRAQMAMLPRLAPRTYYDLVIEVAIVRPGPISGGMVHPYLRRRTGQEPVTYPHPSLEPVLARTLGVPLFQEQVMRLAVIAAGYSPGEADQLRRDMAAWRKTGRLEQHRTRLLQGMKERGIAESFAEQVFQQIRGFGEYGFPESHSASFALISYVGAWLKCHFPAEFLCSLLNSQPMGFYTPATLIEDAKRHGVRVLPIDVGASDWDCTLEPDGGLSFAVRMGLRYVKGLRQGDAEKIVAARCEAPIRSMEQLRERCVLDLRALNALAEAGALAGLEPDRRQALWRARGIARSEPGSLPIETEEVVDLARLDAFEEIAWDYERSGHSTFGHPLAPLRGWLSAQGLPDARTVARMANGHRVKYAGLVICRQRPATASGVTFMTLEDETGFVNVVLWRNVFEAHAAIVKTRPLLGVRGRLQAQDGVTHLVAQYLWVPEPPCQVVAAPSRDFH